MTFDELKKIALLLKMSILLKQGTSPLCRALSVFAIKDRFINSASQRQDKSPAPSEQGPQVAIKKTLLKEC
ncbi:hypothetical protein ACEQPO_19785 [Bacillus sp. SL00103]